MGTKMNEQISWGWAPRGYNSNNWSKFQITAAELRALGDKQDWKCPICLRELAHPWDKAMKTGLKPDIDHQHEEDETKYSKKHVRGFLCKECNVYMGKLNDDPARLQRMITYLKERNQK